MEKRIAVFGGTFNPVHIGHTGICKKLLQDKRYGINKIIIMPCGNPPHKPALTDSRHRLNMCKIAFTGPEYEVSGYEAEREGLSYTYLTLAHIAEKYAARPYYIAGADSVRDMPYWKNPDRIAETCDIIAVNRSLIPGAEAGVAEFKSRYGARVFLSDISVPDVSSTEIRILNSCGLDVSGLAGGDIAAYIREHGICCDYKEYADILRPLMKQKRFMHSVYTAVTAHKLAAAYGADGGKAVIAGLIHDCAKEIDESVIRNKYGIAVPAEIAAMHRKVRHAPLGALLAQKLFGIDDPEIISAVKYHTAGRENMSLLEKVIFIADYIEPTRGYDDTAEKYKLAFSDIDKAAEAKYAEIERKKAGGE